YSSQFWTIIKDFKETPVSGRFSAHVKADIILRQSVPRINFFIDMNWFYTECWDNPLLSIDMFTKHAICRHPSFLSFWRQCFYQDMFLSRPWRFHGWCKSTQYYAIFLSGNQATKVG